MADEFLVQETNESIVITIPRAILPEVTQPDIPHLDEIPARPFIGKAEGGSNPYHHRSWKMACDNIPSRALDSEDFKDLILNEVAIRQAAAKHFDTVNDELLSTLTTIISEQEGDDLASARRIASKLVAKGIYFV